MPLSFCLYGQASRTEHVVGFVAGKLPHFRWISLKVAYKCVSSLLSLSSLPTYPLPILIGMQGDHEWLYYIMQLIDIITIMSIGHVAIHVFLWLKHQSLYIAENT